MAHRGSIGIFDSGIGGLSIARKIRELLPNENIIYVADTYHTPYGDKSDHYILQRSFSITDFLISRNVKAIVVACNTATTTCIEELRARYTFPFIGVEPGIRPGVLHTKSGVIGILATPKTLITNSFSELTKRVAGNIRVEVMPCPDLVTQVETLKLDYNEASDVVRKYVLPLIEKGADTLVLGCTHYAYLAHVVAEVAGPDVLIVSTESAVAKEVSRRLGCERLLVQKNQIGQEEFWSNGSLALFQKQINLLWGKPADTYHF